MTEIKSINYYNEPIKANPSKPKGLIALIDKIGEDSAREFLLLSDKILKQEHQDLLHCLHDAHWENAAKIAHRLKATAHLYASVTLLSYYEKILCWKTLIIKDKNDFIEVLTEELQQVERNIKNFIEESNEK